jgi:hypothetical protein
MFIAGIAKNIVAPKMSNNNGSAKRIAGVARIKLIRLQIDNFSLFGILSPLVNTQNVTHGPALAGMTDKNKGSMLKQAPEIGVNQRYNDRNILKLIFRWQYPQFFWCFYVFVHRAIRA